MNTNISRTKYFVFYGICLIPLIGAFVGLVLTIMGYHLKDKKLIRIGIFGIAFTILVYTCLFVLFKNSENDFKSLYVELTKNQLHQLKNDIDIYKTNYGKYPKSLEELEKTNKFININDPILLNKEDKNIKTVFEYKCTNDTVVLFSVGHDGKPNTKDDIYP
jgi:cell division protein FtsL